jgi:cytochrome c oxidase assembly protein subunit 15
LAVSRTAFRRFSHLTLALTLVVILWGAYVRASGSGAGCGSHWPTCNAEVIPSFAKRSTATAVEFTHRATSGLVFALIAVQCAWALRLFARGHPARRAAAAALLFIVTEALIGAGLVLFEMVAANKSVARAAWVSAHLLNTFALVAALVLTGLRAREAPRASEPLGTAAATALLLGLAGTLIVATSGAIAALGDTLFPARSIAEGWQQDLSPTAHLFVRLRILHPVLALVVGTGLLALTGAMVARDKPSGARGAATLVAALVVAQMSAGLLNLMWLAPIPLQMVHLLLADLVWIALVRLGATVRLFAPALVRQPVPS